MLSQELSQASQSETDFKVEFDEMMYSVPGR